MQDDDYTTDKALSDKIKTTDFDHEFPFKKRQKIDQGE
jgi:hypothetical protein